MDPVTKGSGTTDSAIFVNWSVLTTTSDIGGGTIDSYNLQWDSGSGTTWTDL